MAAAPAESVAGAPGAGPGTAADQVADEVGRFLQQVRTLQDGSHRTVLTLTPERLGPVTLTVDVRRGSVRLAVAGGPEAVAALREGMEELRRQLAESGLDLADVTLHDGGQRRDAGGPPGGSWSAGTADGGRGPGTPGAGTGGSRDGAPGGSGRGPGASAPDGALSPSGPAPVHAGGLRPGRLDVRV
jgi:hypothetical protein